MVLNEGEGLKREVIIDGVHVYEFKYLGWVLDESSSDEADSCRKKRIGEGRRCH